MTPEMRLQAELDLWMDLAARHSAKRPGEDNFDSSKMDTILAQIARTHQGDERAIRNELLKVFKAWMVDVHGELEARFEGDNNGLACAADFSAFQDLLIKKIFFFGSQHVYPRLNPTSGERLCLVATGGYGRGLLAPGSDIDLLILLPYKQTSWGESLLEFILYTLWDLGFKVGHATRTVKQCINTALDDYTIRTALLDSRKLCGDDELFEKFTDSFTNQVIKGRSVEFIEAKLDERVERHKKIGCSRYLVEPDVKEGKGGLRDLHTLSWLLSYTARDVKVIQARANIELCASEKAIFHRCEAFLWTTRCHLHFLSKRPEERLSFDVQIAMAERMSYHDRGGLRAVERFMKHYFLVARDVGELTRIICSALELKQLKQVPVLHRIFDKLKRSKTDSGFVNDEFAIEHGRMNVISKDCFERDPLNIIRLFYIAELNNVLLHPAALRLLQSSFHLINDELRESPEANELFLDILTSPRGVENTLRKMNEAGVLGRFIPEFGKIVCMMQFNMYHRYTVDEHLIRTIGVLARIELGDYAEEHPLSVEIFRSIENSRLLYVALLLHDIAKGRDEDHSIAGWDIAKVLCPRFGLSKAETDIIAWLVKNHLVMSHFAQNRDLSDPKTSSDFAAIVKSRERLKLLLVLTVADIRGVGPGVWNGWKGELLRNLYYETEPVLAGGHTRLDQRRRIAVIVESLRDSLEEWTKEQRDKYIESHYDDYWLKTDQKHQLMHAALVRKSEKKKLSITTKVVTDEFTAITELIVYAQAHPRFLSQVAGACAAAGANIVGAQISTTRDGMALDNFFLQRQFEREEDELRRGKRIAGTIGKLLRGETNLQKLLATRSRTKGPVDAFTIEPIVTLDNKLSQSFTVIEIEALDRPGLLYDLTNELAELNLSVTSAHISTYGERVVDAFYVKDLLGEKIHDEKRWSVIRKRLIDRLKEEE
jgi:[protein-PII] uridylyltransferase